jgi:hypothetical protein
LVWFRSGSVKNSSKRKKEKIFLFAPHESDQLFKWKRIQH